jgi:hypothetical protein
MTALTKSIHRPQSPGFASEAGVKASTEFFIGSLVAVDSTGYAVPASDVAGHVVIGVSEEQIDNTAGANGDKLIQPARGKSWEFACSAADITWVGKKAYVIDDNTVAISGTTNSILAGTITQFTSATAVRVHIDGIVR